MKSIIQENKECYFCKDTSMLECHHVFSGTSNRKNSEKYGLKVWLCNRHHNGAKQSVHHNKDMWLWLKQKAQQIFEESHSREEFIRIFGRNYID